jgi:alanine dehydrogenase
MVVKVKEPQPQERAQLHAGQVLYTYLHLAPDPEQTADLGQVGRHRDRLRDGHRRRGTLPLLKPMSQVAGRMSIQAGATALEKAHGGRGVLLGGVPGVMPGVVVVIGGGVVGFNAAQMAVGLGRRRAPSSTAIPKCSRRTASTSKAAPRRASPTRPTSPSGVRGGPGDRRGAGPGRGGAQAGDARHARLHEARRGAGRRRRSTRAGASRRAMRPRTTTRRSWSTGIVHYCVANMPGAVARTSTYALNNVTLPRALQDRRPSAGSRRCASIRTSPRGSTSTPDT